MEFPEPSQQLPTQRWFTVQIGQAKHTINLSHIVLISSASGGSVVVQLSSGETLGLSVKDSMRLLKEIGES